MASEPRCRELWVQQLVTIKHLNQRHENLGINKLLNNKGSMVVGWDVSASWWQHWLHATTKEIQTWWWEVDESLWWRRSSVLDAQRNEYHRLILVQKAYNSNIVWSCSLYIMLMPIRWMLTYLSDERFKACIRRIHCMVCTLTILERILRTIWKIMQRYIFFQHCSHRWWSEEQIFNIFYTNLHLISLQLNLNSNDI